MLLRRDGFASYRCDRSAPLGINLKSMFKILKCAGNEDSVTLKAKDDENMVTFEFESPHGDKVSDFQLSTLDIDQDSLAIPDTEYEAVIDMPSSEFQRICRDLSTLGETVVISASKDGVKFSVRGGSEQGNIVLRQSSVVDSRRTAKVEKGDSDSEMKVDVKKEKEREDKREDANNAVNITLTEPVTLTFALNYLVQFTKATVISSRVSLSMSQDVPIAVEYSIDDIGYLRFYLAPKIADENEEESK